MLYGMVSDESPYKVSLARKGMPLDKLAKALETEHSLRLKPGNKLGVKRDGGPWVFYRLVDTDKLAAEQFSCRDVLADFAVRDLRGLRMLG